jgi:hypothetical protein
MEPELTTKAVGSSISGSSNHPTGTPSGKPLYFKEVILPVILIL